MKNKAIKTLLVPIMLGAASQAALLKSQHLVQMTM